MAAKILACKLLRKCRREEVSAGVVAVAAQCVEGTTVGWAPYLLNLFLDDCKDAQDFRNKISLLMATHVNSLYGMEGTEIHILSLLDPNQIRE
jgi:hypothetical protein